MQTRSRVQKPVVHRREETEREREREREKEREKKKKDVEWTTAGQCCDGIKIVDPHENERRVSSFNARCACQTASRR